MLTTYTPLPTPLSPMLQKNPSATPVPSLTTPTHPLTATSTQEFTSHPPDIILHVPPDVASPFWFSLDLALGTENEVWIAGLSSLFQFTKAGYYPPRVIDLGDRITSIETFDVTDSGIWLLDNVHNPKSQSRIIHLSFEGKMLDEYKIPRKFFTNIDGQYEESGVNRIFWGEEGELMLSGQAGVFLLLDKQGKMVGKRLYRYYFGTHSYWLERINDNSVALHIDAQIVAISTRLERLYVEVVGFSNNGSVYLRVVEVSEAEINETVRRYNPTGELLCMAQIRNDRNTFVPLAYKSNRGVFGLQSNENRSVDVLEFCPETD